MSPLVRDLPYEIVVVDDESVVCELLKQGLNEDNFLVTGVTRPEEARDVVMAKQPCLVILDMHMPGIDGLGVLKEIKRVAPEIPVVLLTGYAGAVGRDEARRLGACDVLSKPVNWNYLRSIAYLSSFLRDPIQ
jgi:DNA-binding NtrC family response regulator